MAWDSEGLNKRTAAARANAPTADPDFVLAWLPGLLMVVGLEAIGVALPIALVVAGLTFILLLRHLQRRRRRQQIRARRHHHHNYNYDDNDL